jgi:hypothetical protein
MPDEIRIPDPVPDPQEPTAQQLADQFAKLAVAYALRPTPDGLDVLSELFGRMKQ